MRIVSEAACEAGGAATAEGGEEVVASAELLSSFPSSFESGGEDTSVSEVMVVVVGIFELEAGGKGKIKTALAGTGRTFLFSPPRSQFFSFLSS